MHFLISNQNSPRFFYILEACIYEDVSLNSENKTENGKIESISKTNEIQNDENSIDKDSINDASELQVSCATNDSPIDNLIQ